MSEHPFIYEPLASRYFPAQTIEDARSRLIRSVERRQGPALVIGGAGTGKSLLCGVLANHFQSKLRVVHLACGRVATRRALFQAILYELNLPYRGVEEGELRIALLDRLASEEQLPHGLLLLIDEAHTLPVQLLEEIRLLTNLVRGGRARVQLVLAGLPLLDELFAGPRLASFNQRLAARCYLGHLDREETARYVRAQLQRVTDNPKNATAIFSDDALAAIHAATDGIPRLINQLCEHALILASAGGTRQIASAGIDEAWADLQQLPSPGHAAADDGTGGGDRVVEFGSLYDPPDGVTVFSQDGEEETDGTAQAGARESATCQVCKNPGDGLTAVWDADERHGGAEQDNSASAPAGAPFVGGLSKDDEDFQPIGSIGPETEWAFTVEADPFAEPFDEEEVVLDHYGCFEENVLSQLPRLESAAELVEESAEDDDPDQGIVKLNRPRDDSLHEVLVIEDDDALEPPHDGEPGPERKNYRQLFSKLRRS